MSLLILYPWPRFEVKNKQGQIDTSRGLTSFIDFSTSPSGLKLD